MDGVGSSQEENHPVAASEDVHDLTLEDVREAVRFIGRNPEKCKKTPMIHHWKDLGQCSEASRECDLHLKLENMQVTGSYKVRGILNQLHHLKLTRGDPKDLDLVTMSAGNYGKAFAYLTNEYRRRLVVMPSTAPSSRDRIIQNYGAEVERVSNIELQERVNLHINQENMLFCSPLNDLHLIAGHASLGMEILDDVPEPDVVLVPCGGGCLLAGIASAIHLSGCRNCRVYGIEPEGACTMYESLRAGRPLSMPVRTIAAGLAPPFVGEQAMKICQKYVEEILLVSDRAIVRAVQELYRQGLVVEPSAAVGYAALMSGKVPDICGRKVVLLISGGNISPEEMTDLFNCPDE